MIPGTISSCFELIESQDTPKVLLGLNILEELIKSRESTDIHLVSNSTIPQLSNLAAMLADPLRKLYEVKSDREEHELHSFEIINQLFKLLKSMLVIFRKFKAFAAMQKISESDQICQLIYIPIEASSSIKMEISMNTTDTLRASIINSAMKLTNKLIQMFERCELNAFRARNLMGLMFDNFETVITTIDLLILKHRGFLYSYENPTNTLKKIFLGCVQHIDMVSSIAYINQAGLSTRFDSFLHKIFEVIFNILKMDSNDVKLLSFNESDLLCDVQDIFETCVV